MRWPEGRACGVLVTVDLDGDAPFRAAAPENAGREKSRSVGRYGLEEGAARLLRVLDDVGLAADWFVPGLTTRENPGLIREIAARGHALSSHGDLHLDFNGLTLEEQMAEILGGRAALEEALGGPGGGGGAASGVASPALDAAPPALGAGFRVPSGEWAPGFPEAALAEGFRWSSSLPADERPFRCGVGGLVEIPFRYELEDHQYLGYNLDPPFPPGQSRIAPIETVRENWELEYRGAVRYGTLFHLRLSAELMGTPGRAAFLRDFLLRIREDDAAWLGTCGSMAAWCEGLEPEADHPYGMFARLRAAERA
ncbi:polysaccharide deacetylase family protein [Rothia sp. AR01]|uniref:Polysaccharide deacetylase family protein n=1 Tax=Rothia santali TaxID=2949643 RepID=A0A9X2KI34_9MICC|nr:polysaccharide deacetylase family protein [Rothia santali]MCP3425575.1 polysaccharide deacetylase family protein [Rothia santali]